MKKLFALALAALMAFSVVAIAAEEDIMLISEEEGAALEEVMPSYLTNYGEIAEVNNEEGYVLVKTDLEEIRFNMDENTLLIGNDGASRFELATGKKVAVSHSMAMTMSALPLLRKESKKPGPACMPMVKIKRTSPKLPSSLGMNTPKCPKSKAMKITADTSRESPLTLMRPNIKPSATIRNNEK